MKVQKEIVEKIKSYSKAKKESDQLFEELNEWANENGFEDFYVTGFGIAEEPSGEEQKGGEYCNQWTHWEDSGDGIYYYPIEGDTSYIYVNYSF